jgi:adenine-specific DNA-methyltransferase
MRKRGDPAVSTDQPERLDLTSTVPTDGRLKVLRATFPEVFREGKIDPDALRRSIGDWVDPGPERFGLSWPGKAECMRVIQEPSIGTLVPMPEESVDWDTTENVIIEGENLEVLKLLQKAYYGKVKLIYIDPPYNTGKEFIYPDNFKEGLADYLRYSGQVDEEGFKLSANTETDGRYHSKWLSMMYPRLFLARNLLTEDGLIFVSIDDHEVHNLRALMNEIFGEENFVANAVWQKAYVSNMTAKHFSNTHDHVVVFGRDIQRLAIHKTPRTEVQLAKFTNPDEDPRGPWKAENLSAGKYYSAGTFEIETPSGRVVTPPPRRYWRCNRAQFDEWFEEGRIWFGASGDGRPMLKKYLSQIDEGLTPSTWWPHEEYGSNKEASLELKALFGGEAPFDTPKPTKLLQRIVEFATDSDSLVLDFFSGSGTAGEAVLQTNANDGGSRQYILVQLPEPLDDEKYPTLASVVRRRMKLAGESIRSRPVELDRSEIDLGFRAMRLASSSFTIWNASTTTPQAVEEQLEMSVEHVIEGAAEQSMLTELLLKAGYSLTSPVEEVDFGGVSGYAVAEGALLICLSSELSIEAFEAMVEQEPAMILVLDAGFGGSDELKVNALQTVRARNQQSGSDIALRVV